MIPLCLFAVFIGFIKGSHTGVGGETAVDGQDNAGDKAGCFVIDEEQQAAFQLAVFAEAAHGGSGKDLAGTGRGRAILLEEQASVLIGNEEAGGNGIDADADAGEMDSQPLGEVGDGSLGAGIGGDLGQRGVGIHGTDVDDVAAFAADHLAGECLRRDQRTDEVEIEDELDAALVEIEERFDLGIEQVRLLEEIMRRIGARVVAAGTV